MEASVERESLTLQHTLDSRRAELELTGQSHQAQSWLGSHLETSQGTDQVYEALEKRFEHPDFVHTLQLAKDAHLDRPFKPQGSEVLQSSWWNVAKQEQDSSSLSEADHDFTEVAVDTAGPAPEPLTSYVMVEHEDVVEAIGTFVAAYLVQLPEADKLRPEELQVAVKHAFQELRKGRVRRLWEWGRCLYRCIAFSYGSFSVYQNPWLVRALLAAIWTASKVILGGVATLL